MGVALSVPIYVYISALLQLFWLGMFKLCLIYCILGNNPQIKSYVDNVTVYPVTSYLFHEPLHILACDVYWYHKMQSKVLMN